MTTRLFESIATFKKCTAEKLTFVILGLFDLVLTVLAINLGFHEINPLMQIFLQIPLALLLIKLFVPVLIAWLAPGKLLWPSIALLAFVVIWNTVQMIGYYV